MFRGADQHLSPLFGDQVSVGARLDMLRAEHDAEAHILATTHAYAPEVLLIAVTPAPGIDCPAMQAAGLYTQVGLDINSPYKTRYNEHTIVANEREKVWEVRNAKGFVVMQSVAPARGKDAVMPFPHLVKWRPAVKGHAKRFEVTVSGEVGANPQFRASFDARMKTLSATIAARHPFMRAMEREDMMEMTNRVLNFCTSMIQRMMRFRRLTQRMRLLLLMVRRMQRLYREWSAERNRRFTIILDAWIAEDTAERNKLNAVYRKAVSVANNARIQDLSRKMAVIDSTTVLHRKVALTLIYDINLTAERYEHRRLGRLHSRILPNVLDRILPVDSLTVTVLPQARRKLAELQVVWQRERCAALMDEASGRSLTAAGETAAEEESGDAQDATTATAGDAKPGAARREPPTTTHPKKPDLERIDPEMVESKVHSKVKQRRRATLDYSKLNEDFSHWSLLYTEYSPPIQARMSIHNGGARASVGQRGDDGGTGGVHTRTPSSPKTHRRSLSSGPPRQSRASVFGVTQTPPPALPPADGEGRTSIVATGGGEGASPRRATQHQPVPPSRPSPPATRMDSIPSNHSPRSISRRGSMTKSAFPTSPASPSTGSPRRPGTAFASATSAGMTPETRTPADADIGGPTTKVVSPAATHDPTMVSEVSFEEDPFPAFPSPPCTPVDGGIYRGRGLSQMNSSSSLRNRQGSGSASASPRSRQASFAGTVGGAHRPSSAVPSIPVRASFSGSPVGSPRGSTAGRSIRRVSMSASPPRRVSIRPLIETPKKQRSRGASLGRKSSEL